MTLKATLLAASILVSSMLTGCSTDFYPLDGQNEAYYYQHRKEVPLKSPNSAQ